MTPSITSTLPGQAVEPTHSLHPHTQPGHWIAFTDKSYRKLHKVETTYQSNANRVMVTHTYLFDENEVQWLTQDPNPSPF